MALNSNLLMDKTHRNLGQRLSHLCWEIAISSGKLLSSSAEDISKQRHLLSGVVLDTVVHT